jgi:hypothetical protein
MKLLVNVTGLKKIVFNRSVVYKLREQNGNKYWERTDGGGKRANCYVTYDKMCANLWALGLDPKNDAWVHGDTFNVKTQAKMKVKSEKPKNKKKHKNDGLNFTGSIDNATASGGSGAGANNVEQNKEFNSIERFSKVIDAVDAAVKTVENKRRKHPKEISFRGNPKTKWKQA